jgi:hypothetical protein
VGPNEYYIVRDSHLTGRADKGQDFFLWVQFTLIETKGQLVRVKPHNQQWHKVIGGDNQGCLCDYIPHKTRRSEMFCLVGALLGGGNLLLKDFQAKTPWKYFHKY